MTAARMQIQLNRTATRRLKAVAASIGASPMSVLMTALHIHLDAMEHRELSNKVIKAFRDSCLSRGINNDR